MELNISEVYRRRILHELYGGQQQGGISTPSNHNFIMLFTSETGEQYGYRDGWNGNKYFYTGEGQRGDMKFQRGNVAIRDHHKNNKKLHLFKYVRMGHVEYLGEMVCTGHHIRRGPDVDGKMRDVIVFELITAE